jgi:hypothetical protein
MEDLERTFPRTRADGVKLLHSRASILNRLITHDAFHSGEISQLLGSNGLPGIDLWARRPS